MNIRGSFTGEAQTSRQKAEGLPALGMRGESGRARPHVVGHKHKREVSPFDLHHANFS